MHLTRQAVTEDLIELLALYRHLAADMPDLPHDLAECRWQEILAAKYVTVFVTVVDGTLAASSTLITAPNLMRGATPHGFLENVVTRYDRRRRGYGRDVVQAALKEAWARGCRRVLLVTGRMHRTPYVADFYGSCGFTSGKAGLMAQRPSLSPASEPIGKV